MAERIALLGFGCVGAESVKPGGAGSLFSSLAGVLPSENRDLMYI